MMKHRPKTTRRARASARGARWWVAGGLLLSLASTGCVTMAEFRKLEERVIDSSRSTNNGPDPFERIAALSAEVEALQSEQRRLSGELEVAQKTADDALAEARKARQALATQSAGGAVAVTGTRAALIESANPTSPVPVESENTSSAEVASYQEALAAWRANDQKVCIEQFRKFLQSYPQSSYADDAAYWMADCHFKQGDYRVAVLRFNDVVRVYPNGNKAPDALYRQGESLLKLGPGFYDAARTVFKQVLKDYPDSARAKEAQNQLEAIGNG